MSSIKREREPDLNQFRIEYVISDDIPVETYFMALNEREAIKMLARSCLKHLSGGKLSDQAVDCFVDAFANPGQPFLEAPEMLTVPEPLPDLEVVTENPIKNEDRQSTGETQKDSGEVFATTEDDQSEGSLPADPFRDSSDQKETKPKDKTSDEQNVFAAPPKETKPDPAIEHAEKKQVRDEEIIVATTENQRRREEFENLCSMALSRVEELNLKLSILKIEEHNRWSDEWNCVPYPLPNETKEPSEHPEE